jgi:hypothetical protein
VGFLGQSVRHDPNQPPGFDSTSPTREQRNAMHSPSARKLGHPQEGGERGFPGMQSYPKIMDIFRVQFGFL